jgi:CRISPR-associated protein Cas2
MFILIAYDIADDRRLKQVAKLMEAYGERVQRSVFECLINDHQLQVLMHKLKHLMKRNEDKVQFYHLCEACEDRTSSSSQASFVDEDVYVC